MFNTSLKKKNHDCKTIFVQWGDYKGKNKRINTHFELIYDVTKEELRDIIEDGLKALMSEKSTVEQHKLNEKE